MNEFITRIDNSLNAILVKDLRQIVRGRFIWSILIIYLAAIVFILGFPLLVNDYHGSNDGADIALTMLGCLFFASALLVPLQLGKKTTEEVSDSTYELLFVTTMKPSSVINGKFLGGLVTITMLHSALAPFLALTLFLGGIDIKYLIVGMIYCYFISCLAVLFQVFHGIYNGKAEGAVSFGSKVGVGLFHFIIWCWAASIGAELVSGRFFNYTKAAEMWSICFYFIAGGIILSMIFYSLTVSKLEPETSNKTRTFKIICSIIWVAGSIISSFTDELFHVWCILVSIALCFISLALLVDPDDYSDRVLKEIPKSPVTRLFNFPYFTGMANSICWILMTAFFNIVLASVFRDPRASFRSDSLETVLAINSILLYVNAIFLISNFIRKLIMPDKPKTSCIPIFIGIFLFNTIMPLFVRSYNSPGLLGFISPFFVFLGRSDSCAIALITGGVFWTLGFMLNSPAIFKQLGAFFGDTPKTMKPHRPIYKDNYDLEQS